MTVLIQSQVKNGQSLTASGSLGGAGSGILWSGSVTDVIAADGGAPYSGDYDDYFGTMAAVTALLGAPTWANAALAAIGAPVDTVGLGEWGGMLNTTSLDTIAYTFSAPVPAGAAFTLVDPGASYDEYAGDETYAITATDNGVAVSTSGWSYQIETPNGAAPKSALSISGSVVTVTSYAGAAWPDSILVITPNVPITSLSVTATTIPYDFWALDLPHLPSALLFLAVNTANATLGELASWQLNATAITGGGDIGNPGTVWAYMGEGDFRGDGGTDVLWRNQNGTLAYWAISGTSIYAAGVIGSPGGTWNASEIVDVNGDGRSDILFTDLQGDLFVWEMNGASIIGGGNLGNPGPTWRLVGAGAFFGVGTGGLLFENASGVFVEWQVSGATITHAITLGAAPAGFAYAGVADVTGSGETDVLFRNPTTGQYDAWLMSASGYSSLVTLCTPGVDETLVATGTFTANSAQDLIFENSLTGVLSDYQFANGQLTASGAIANAGSAWAVANAPFGGALAPPPTVFFTDSAGDVATWTVSYDSIQGGALYSSPGSQWSFVAAADFYGLGTPDVLFENAAGQYAIWETNGSQIVGGGNLGGPGAGWKYAGVGDFNGDGLSDILFENGSGEYAAWLMDGTTIIGGGSSLGVPGAGETLVGIGDLTGDGASDLIFESQNGFYEAWFIANDAYAGVATIGGAGASWSVVGTADFNGDGRADILLENTNGTFATWDMNGADVIGGGQFTGPGAGWAYFGVSDLNGDRDASVLFRNTGTGAVLAYNMQDGTVYSTTTIGTPGSGYTPIAAI